jgi:large conductance mechanosensitive channel
MQIRHFWDEFKKFAFRGNMLDMAVAVVIGNAFGAVVNSLVKNIIMPLVGYAAGVADKDGKLESYQQWHIGQVEIGPFLAELSHFLIVALAMFVLVVKLFGGVQRMFSRHKDEPATKTCPFCLSMIPFAAVKCSQCTSELDGHRGGHPDREPVGAGSA